VSSFTTQVVVVAVVAHLLDANQLKKDLMGVI
jgi:hypothetical protein